MFVPVLVLVIVPCHFYASRIAQERYQSTVVMIIETKAPAQAGEEDQGGGKKFSQTGLTLREYGVYFKVCLGRHVALHTWALWPIVF